MTYPAFGRSLVGAFSLLALSAACACGSSDRTTYDDVADGSGGSAGEDGGTLADGASGTGPTCGANAYSETAPSPTASVADVAFSAADLKPFVLGVLGKRYPLGKAIVEGGLLYTEQGSCIDRYVQDKSSAKAVMKQLSTVVHECGHFDDLDSSKGGESTYHIRQDLSFSCQRGDTTSRGGVTFARSRITKDAYGSAVPPCGGKQTAGCDFYADIYLDGNPDDAKFESGDQGYSFLLEEATQYVNSLATAYAFEDALAGGKVSERDGILTFQWYLERYLKLARDQFPTVHKFLREDACFRAATLTVFDRGNFYLDKTAGSATLGLNDTKLAQQVAKPELKAEIDELRALECK